MSEKNYLIGAIIAILEDLRDAGFIVVSEKDLLDAIGVDAAQQNAQRTCAKCGASTWANAIKVGGKEICTKCSASRWLE